MKASIIIPVYNEEKIIQYTLNKLKKNIPEDCEIIVIDDYSSDNTCSLVKEKIKDFRNLKLISNQSKGFANALKLGFRLANNEIIIPVMADSCDQMEMIPKMYEKIMEGYDIVCGSRYIKGGERKGSPFFKTLLSLYFNKMVHLFTKIPNTDSTNPFKAYRKYIFNNLHLNSKGFEISMEIVLKAYLNGYKITELPTLWEERVSGDSHFSLFEDSYKFLKIFIYSMLKS